VQLERRSTEIDLYLSEYAKFGDLVELIRTPVASLMAHSNM
jgi:hypothetical protein